MLACPKSLCGYVFFVDCSCPHLRPALVCAGAAPRREGGRGRRLGRTPGGEHARRRVDPPLIRMTALATVILRMLRPALLRARRLTLLLVLRLMLRPHASPRASPRASPAVWVLFCPRARSPTIFASLLFSASTVVLLFHRSVLLPLSSSECGPWVRVPPAGGAAEGGARAALPGAGGARECPGGARSGPGEDAGDGSPDRGGGRQSGVTGISWWRSRHRRCWRVQWREHKRKMLRQFRPRDHEGPVGGTRESRTGVGFWRSFEAPDNDDSGAVAIVGVSMLVTTVLVTVEAPVTRERSTRNRCDSLVYRSWYLWYMLLGLLYVSLLLLFLLLLLVAQTYQGATSRPYFAAQFRVPGAC